MGLNSWMLMHGVSATVRMPVGETIRDIRKSPFIVSNHISYLDGPIIVNEFEGPKVVIKKDIQAVPLVGQFMDDMGAIWVDRADPNSTNA